MICEARLIHNPAKPLRLYESSRRLAAELTAPRFSIRCLQALETIDAVLFDARLLEVGRSSITYREVHDAPFPEADQNSICR